MKYLFNDTVYENYSDLEDAMNDYASDTYDDFLDDIYGEVNICGYEYYSSYVWKQIDSIAYDCGFDDYLNMLFEDVVEIEDEETENDEQ